MKLMLQNVSNLCCKYSVYNTRMSKARFAYFHTQHIHSQSGPDNHENGISSTDNDASGLQDDISSHIIHNTDDIIAVNKPRFLSVHGNNETEKSTLRQLMTEREKHLGVSDLEVGLSLKSFYSGIVMFCKTTDSKAKMEKLISGAAAQKVPFISYLAITVGVPECLHNVNLEMSIAREYLHNREMSIVCERTSHSARKLGNMMSVCYKVNPLIVSERTGTALVEISLNKDKWEAAEVLLSHHRSPVFGDHTYSSRTYTIFGITFSASPHSAPPAPQLLPNSVVNALSEHPITDQIADSQYPIFLHRHKVTLSHFPSQGCPPLTVSARPPSDFLSVLQYLGLYDEDMFTSNSGDDE